jgi:superfamily II DNA or RNA helicase
MSFRKLSLDINYTGKGEDILRSFVLPVLAEAVEYDRVTSFFTTESLVAIAEGIENLWHRKGCMRLVLGLHDVPADLVRAAQEAEDPTSQIIAQVRQRIIDGIATISDELSISRLSTIAWMMKDGLLSVKVAAPEMLESGLPGVFHNKVFIFKDENKDIVAAVGSPNETGAGLGRNFEHLTAFMSWEQPLYTNAQANFFERLWADEQEGLQVCTLDADFADQIIETIGHSRPKTAPFAIDQRKKMQELLDIAARMPALRMVAGSHTALYPHQELVFVDGLSRWPVRVMLADEVGLGKTFEAGAMISYMIAHAGVSRTLVLAPKAVVYQWQAELSEQFGLDAWVYESERKTFVSPNSEVVVLRPEEPILGARTPRISIISAQLARGTRKKGHIFEPASVLPDLLVVDEAHAARVKPDLADKERPTLMWKMLKGVVLKIPHIIFATATPMQVHWREYHALLELLGLPDDWVKPDNYRRSLDLATQSDGVELTDASLTAKLIRASLSGFSPSDLDFSSEEMALARFIETTDDSVKAAIRTQSEWNTARMLLVKTHPARFLTMRNTRTALKAIGYTFPTRNLPPFSLDVPDDVKYFYEHVETYLSQAYFEVERALFPDRKFSIGFVKCAYQQRLASSLSACRLSLLRRRERVSQIEEGAENLVGLEQEIDELTESDVYDQEPVFEFADKIPAGANLEQAIQAAQIERVYLDDLIDIIDRTLSAQGDPKLHGTIELLHKHLDQGDKVLVFSRYTDTLSAVIQAFRADFSGKYPPYAIYTGSSTEIDLGTGSERASRTEIQKALEEGPVRVVFCSEAASEGLNLQAARVIVNVDVPWNPARLEQRIGRVARLGQASSSVDIYNLWYPESIEAKMYLRLMERADLYELAVGEFPDVVGTAIRDLLASKFGTASDDRDVVSELNELKNDKQIRALRTLWDRHVTKTTLTERFRRELASLAISAARGAGASIAQNEAVFRISQENNTVAFSVEPGRNDVISLGHPALRWLARVENRSPNIAKILSDSRGPGFFVTDNGPVDPTTVPELLHLMSEIQIDEEFSAIQVLKPQKDGTLSSRWLPNAQAMTVPVQLECPCPSPPRTDFQAMTTSEPD